MKLKYYIFGLVSFLLIFSLAQSYTHKTASISIKHGPGVRFDADFIKPMAKAGAETGCMNWTTYAEKGFPFVYWRADGPCADYGEISLQGIQANALVALGLSVGGVMIALFTKGKQKSRIESARTKSK